MQEKGNVGKWCLKEDRDYAKLLVCEKIRCWWFCCYSCKVVIAGGVEYSCKWAQYMQMSQYMNEISLEQLK